MPGTHVIAPRAPDAVSALETPAFEPKHHRYLTAAIVVPVVVVALAAGFRLWGLGSPHETYWDEGYYALDAYGYLSVFPAQGSARGVDFEQTWVHPPLGKELISVGVAPLGFTPVGWRLVPALFGVAAVLFLYLLALELWGSVWWAGLAAGLLALDGVHIVQSRMATLDVFVTTFVLAAVYFVVLDRTRDPGSSWPDRWFGSRFRLLAGVMLGAAIASKWSGLFAVPLVVALTLLWGRRTSPHTILLPLLAVPLGVYVIAYTPWFVEHGLDAGRFIHLQAQMLHAQLHHPSVQPENSSPASWPILGGAIRYRPSELYLGPVRNEIILAGNPVLWIGFLLAAPLLLLVFTRKRDWRNVVPLAGYAGMYLPWLAFSRTQFLYYMTPAVPFMALAVAAALRSLPCGREPAAIGFGAGTVLAAAAFAPVWLGVGAPSGWLHALDALTRWR